MRRYLTFVLSALLFGALTVGGAQGEPETYLSANGSDPETTRGASRLLRYQLEDFPVAVFVPPPPVDQTATGGAPAEGASGDASWRRQEVIRAFDAWAEAVPEIVSWTFVDVPDEETLVVSWEALLPQRVGSYRYAFSVTPTNEYRFRATRVILDPNTPAEDLYRFALLQVGHALGLLGRSPFEGDALSAVPSGVVSERDVATLRALYALPSGTVLHSDE
jgi:hypothetical protein